MSGDELRRSIARRHLRQNAERFDRLFRGLMVGQFVVGMLVATISSPRAWAGTESTVHSHVLLAGVLGLAIFAPALYCIQRHPAASITRHAIAAAQAMFTGLLIHLWGGRIEAHFHVFCSLALLSGYRDWRPLLTFAALTAVDHIARGLLWPDSIFGADQARDLQWLEHVTWVVCTGVVLAYTCHLFLQEVERAADREATLEETKASIEALVQERTTDLMAARARAEHSSRAKSAFLANTSHEIRTPMNGIVGTAQILGESELDADQREWVDTMIESGDDLLRLIDDLLDLSKVESGQLELVERPLDLRDCVERVVRLVRPRVSSGVSLVTELDDALLPLYLGDDARIRQILINLVGNAAKFTEEGEVAVRVSRIDGGVEIRVQDTGIGIPPGALDRVFDSFTQVDSAETRAYGGTGLGLAITRSVVQLMGGSVAVESEVGAGSTFTCRIPLAAAEPSAPIAAEATRESRGPVDARVLLVEDNAVNRRVATRLLERIGCVVQTAENGALALEAARAGGHDLILMDLQMPVMGGLDACRALLDAWERGGVAPVPIVAMTADAMEHQREACIDAGMSGFLTKPVRAQLLEDAVRRHCAEADRVA